MSTTQPDLEFLLSSLKQHAQVGQIIVSNKAADAGHIIHIDDEKQPVDSLTQVSLSELRSIVSSTADGKFRPLKSAPNLKSGWIYSYADSSQLKDALDIIYPGFVSDFYYLHSNQNEHLGYFSFAGRQTGMYKATGSLSESELSHVIAGCCQENFCQKLRWWDSQSNPSQPISQNPEINIPCLEPCAPFMELARIQAKCEQSDKINVEMSQREWDVIVAALDWTSKNPPSQLKDGEVYNVKNPKRTSILMSKISTLTSKS